MRHLETVKRYFDCWLTKAAEALPEIFAEDAVYTECYGPQYSGLVQIQRWFWDWNKRGEVLCWEIKDALDGEDTLCVEWYFACCYDGNSDGFDGVSWIEFDERGRITALREYQSKAEHIHPYGLK